MKANSPYQESKAIILLLGLLLCLFSPATGQDTSGKIRGVVADTSGAVIPDATVKARNTATNAEAQVVSKEDGSYAFESLVPGNYEVSSEKTGFKTLVATDTRVEAQKTTTLNVQLQVGEVSDQVTVEGAATQVDVSTPTLQTTLNTQALLSLPVQGRNVRLAAESIQPGAVVQGNGNVSYNGNRSASGNNYKVDGGDVNNYFNGLASENSTFPQAENLEEFSVLTNSTDAKYGNASGAQVTAVVKSGTNDLHGMGWGYFENQGLAANSWASNRQGVARVPGSQRWLGGNIGGPVFLPRFGEGGPALYNGRDKTFFFFSYEYTNPSRSNLSSFIVPTAAERAGNFSSGTYPCPVINGQVSCQVDPNNYSPLAKRVFALGLLPQGDATGRFSYLTRRNIETNAYVYKFDHLIGSKHRISASLNRNNQDPTSDDFGSCCGLPGVLPNSGIIGNPHYITSLFFNHVYTINSNMINTLSVGGARTRVAVTRAGPNEAITWANLGVPGITPERTATPGNVQLFVQAWSPAGFALFGGYFDDRTSKTTNISDNFSWIKGRHTLEMGYNQRLQKQTKVGNYQSGGELVYANWTGASSGNPWADFFLDIGGQFSQSGVEDVTRHYPSNSAYFQDRFKATSKLTMTLGLRWDPNRGYVEENNKFSQYRRGQKSEVFPNAPVGLVFYGDKEIYREGYAPSWTKLNPRVGLAYDLTGSGRMSIRAGYGSYSDYYTQQDIALNAGSPFSFGYSTGSRPGSFRIGQDPYDGQNLFPSSPPLPGSPEARNFIFPSGPQGSQMFNSDFNSGRVHQWNVNFQWEPVNTYVMTLAYVSNRGTHLLGVVDANAPVFIPGASTNANAQSRRPDQNFTGIGERFSGLNSRYNALQASVNKRYADGLTFLANYTFAKALGDAGGGVPNEGGDAGYRDPYRRFLDYGPTAQDIRHSLAISYAYDLPFFRNSNGFLKFMAGGWTFGGILRAYSGDPLTISSSAPFNAGSGGAFANYVGGDNYGDHGSRASQAESWLNRAAFCRANEALVNGQCTLDPTAGVTALALGNTTRGFARGPNKFFNDMTLSKNFPFSERWGILELRAAAFNVFNHTVLGNPDTSLDSSNFGKIFNAYPNRSLQLSLRYKF